MHTWCFRAPRCSSAINDLMLHPCLDVRSQDAMTSTWTRFRFCVIMLRAKRPFVMKELWLFIECTQRFIYIWLTGRKKGRSVWCLLANEDKVQVKNRRLQGLFCSLWTLAFIYPLKSLFHSICCRQNTWNPLLAFSLITSAPALILES